MVQGNLWDYWDAGWKVVITTNVGWDSLRCNNMGAGMALQAAMKFPWLPEWYGEQCEFLTRRHDGRVLEIPPIEHSATRLIFMPVKPLLLSRPAWSWDQNANIPLIRLGLFKLRQHTGKIALALPGCGNGALSPREVLPYVKELIVARAFADQPTILVDRNLDEF